MDYLEIRSLYHHGIKGQRWGIRRFQNEDGSLTPRGKKQQEKEEKSEQRRIKYPLSSATVKGAKVFAKLIGAGLIVGTAGKVMGINGLMSLDEGQVKVADALMLIGGTAILAAPVAGAASGISSGVKNVNLRKENRKGGS